MRRAATKVRKLVEEHLKECEECRLLAEDMKESISDKKVPAQNDAQVLKKPAWIIIKEQFYMLSVLC